MTLLETEVTTRPRKSTRPRTIATLVARWRELDKAMKRANSDAEIDRIAIRVDTVERQLAACRAATLDEAAAKARVLKTMVRRNVCEKPDEIECLTLAIVDDIFHLADGGGRFPPRR